MQACSSVKYVDLTPLSSVTMIHTQTEALEAVTRLEECIKEELNARDVKTCVRPCGGGQHRGDQRREWRGGLGLQRGQSVRGRAGVWCVMVD